LLANYNDAKENDKIKPGQIIKVPKLG
jgi:hypothetical protein